MKIAHVKISNILGIAELEFTPEGFEARVEAEVQKRIKERADGVIEILDSLREKLENADELIKPHWEE